MVAFSPSVFGYFSGFIFLEPPTFVTKIRTYCFLRIWTFIAKIGIVVANWDYWVLLCSRLTTTLRLPETTDLSSKTTNDIWIFAFRSFLSCYFKLGLNVNYTPISHPPTPILIVLPSLKEWGENSASVQYAVSTVFYYGQKTRTLFFKTREE